MGVSSVITSPGKGEGGCELLTLAGISGGTSAGCCGIGGSDSSYSGGGW